MDWLYHPLYADLPPIFWGIFVFIGAAIGSFYNVLALRWGKVYRFSREKEVLQDGAYLHKPHLPLMAGRSHCPKCSQMIPLYHNIPLISWLFLRGRSVCCGSSIAPIYLLFELLGAVVFLLIALSVGPTVYGLVLAVLLMTLSLSIRLYAREGFVPQGLVSTSNILAIFLVLGPGLVSPEGALIAYAGMTAFGALMTRTWASRNLSGPFKPHDVMLMGLLGLVAGTQGLSALGMAIAPLAIAGWCLPRRWKLFIAARLGSDNQYLFSFTSLILVAAVAHLLIQNLQRALS
ncbi:prepilin peptidase [Pseudomonas fluorescens]|uniref:prepilin peptidase n=1 Tax=Pseudomonas TaxID=286 RepID=UPI000F0374FC|nr:MULTISPECIES: prepilin peptidase [Pseudomonas]MBD8089351.1 prepilin peptidase [Pseudomonas fluorescens]MBD8615222.1 prepilin peptidase [Pseudomonas putida]MBD8682124.1 prepilin peptidase [Pseudomonas sp. CFBP 13719]